MIKSTCRERNWEILITHISQALPQVAVHCVLVAVALQVSDDADLKGLRSEEVPKHVQNARSLKKKNPSTYSFKLTQTSTVLMLLQSDADLVV